MDLNKFQMKSQLFTNPNEKVSGFLGTFEGSQQEAIIIITAKIPQKEHLQIKSQQMIFQNDIYSKFKVIMEGEFNIQMIYPITQKHKQKYRKKQISIIEQNKQQYNKNKQNLLQKQLKHLQWINNIINGQAQIQRILYRNEQYIILPDFKFNYNKKNTSNLYLLTIFINPKLTSIRDLNSQHITLLQKVEIDINKVLKQYFQLELNKCRIYFHYPPTFYRLHLHITHLALENKSCRVQRCHMLSTVLQNLKLKCNYYQQISLNTFIQV